MSDLNGKKLVEGEDYYLTKEGYRVFTEKYLLKRGYCCNNGCKHCPYKKSKKS
jgi:2-iminoacetate synthase ThiH